MDFTGRNPQPAQPQSSASSSGSKKTKPRSKAGLWAGGVLGLLIVVLVVALILVIGFGGPKKEDSFVDNGKMQAVFLNTGQVYFGDIKSLNSKYFVLDNIYYLQTASTGTSSTSSAANTSVSLVKLGCELHAPYDQMVINRDQVTFWENLQSDGQVAKAVATFQKDNPNGQKCADQSAAGASQNSVQNGTSTQTAPTTTKK